MRKDDWKRERDCTRKRAFRTQFYAEKFAENILEMDPADIGSYHCRHCGEVHLKDAPKKNAKRFR